MEMKYTNVGNVEKYTAPNVAMTDLVMYVQNVILVVI